MRSRESKGFCGRNRKFKRFFRPKTGDLQKKKGLHRNYKGFPAEIANSSVFSGRKQMISKRKKRSSSQKRHKIWCQSTKNTNLDLDLRSRSPDPVNFFRAQSSLGGAQFSFGGAQALSLGGQGPGMPPVAPGLPLLQTTLNSTSLVEEKKTFFLAARPLSMLLNNSRPKKSCLS